MTKIQYTIRNIPPEVDRVIRKRADQSGQSFNQTVVDLLTLQTFGSTSTPADDNFDWFFGSMTLDEEFDKAIDLMSRPDKDFWA